MLSQRPRRPTNACGSVDQACGADRAGAQEPRWAGALRGHVGTSYASGMDEANGLHGPVAPGVAPSADAAGAQGSREASVALSDVEEDRHGSDSDFAVGSDGGADDPLADAHNSAADSLSSSDYGSLPGKRRGDELDRAGKRARLDPGDNHMLRKLRQLPADGEHQGSAQTSDQPDDGPASSGEPPVLERPRSAEQEAQERAALRGAWELASVLEFLEVFHAQLGMPRRCSAAELEAALVLNPGGPGVLADVHLGLLRGISTRSELTEHNWATRLGDRLRVFWQANGVPGRPPFAPARGQEALEYARLPTLQRLQALKALCEARLDREDVLAHIESALQPARVTARAIKRGEPPPPALSEFRKTPFGVDSGGLVYWYLDLGHATGDVRLYRETPAAATAKGRGGGKGRGAKAKPPAAGAWELLADSLDALREAGEKLRRNKQRPEQRLASQVLERLVPQLEERRVREERERAAADRLAAMQAATFEAQAGLGRSRRARKVVDYSGQAYDAMLRSALRSEARDPSSRRPVWEEPPRLSAVEEAQLGKRRGRSAFAAPPLPSDSLALETRRRRDAARQGGDASGGLQYASGDGATGSAGPSSFSDMGVPPPREDAVGERGTTDSGYSSELRQSGSVDCIAPLCSGCSLGDAPDMLLLADYLGSSSDVAPPQSAFAKTALPRASVLEMLGLQAEPGAEDSPSDPHLCGRNPI
ncbi:hypothetical protein WJX81_007008 [Elliptochloris bilobata]|uniref:DDT domain-containing protein n=1 Tax=Elliptochloris bilobata TaxID=381761 RepID=A0AAW1RP27_9CHLO